MRYTAVFEFDGDAPRVAASDGWKGGKLCAVAFQDDLAELEKVREELDITKRDLVEARRLLSQCTDAELPGWLHSAIARALPANA